MDIFDIIKMNSPELLEACIEKDPMLLDQKKMGLMTPWQYAMAENNPEAFGIIIRAMSKYRKFSVNDAEMIVKDIIASLIPEDEIIRLIQVLINAFPELKHDKNWINKLNYLPSMGRFCTPLSAACLLGYAKLAKILVAMGADPKDRNEEELNLIHQVISYKHLPAYPRDLIAWLIDISDSKMPLQEIDRDHGSLLEFSLNFRNIHAVEHLLSLGANIHTPLLKPGDHNKTCADLIVDQFILYEQHRKKILDIIKKYLDVLDPKLWGRISLHDAVKQFNYPLLSLLLQLKRDPNEIDVDGFTPYDYAYTLLETPKTKMSQKHAEALLDIIRLLSKYVPNRDIEACQVPGMARLNAIKISGLEPILEEIYARDKRKFTFVFRQVSLATHLSSPKDTISQHKQLMWDLHQKNQKKHWHQTCQNAAKISVTIGETVLNFLDCRAETDYEYIVHTTCDRPESLKETLATSAKFIRETPFFSASLVDKDIPAAEMSHQGKAIFPLSLILELEEGAVLKSFPVDAWSPQLTTFPEDRVKDIAQVYVKKLKKQNAYFNEREARIRGIDSSAVDLQSDGDQKTQNEIKQSLDMETILKIHQNDPAFVAPGRDIEACIPELTPLQTLKHTRSHYNEIIVAGRPKNKIIGIMVEESALMKFKEEFSCIPKPPKRAAKAPERVDSVDKKIAHEKFSAHKPKWDHFDESDEDFVSDHSEDYDSVDEDAAADFWRVMDKIKRDVHIERMQEAPESLKILAACPIPLILVRTNKNGYDNKLSVRDKIKQIQKRYEDTIESTTQLLFRQYRLQKQQVNSEGNSVRDSEGNSAESTVVGSVSDGVNSEKTAAKLASLNSVKENLLVNMEQLKELRGEALRLKGLVKS